MFDLRANFVAKVEGNTNFNQITEKYERAFFLCINKQIFEQLLEEFPKSKLVAQKRALMRRRFFMQQLQKLEMFLEMKRERQRLLVEQKMARANYMKNELTKSH